MPTKIEWTDEYIARFWSKVDTSGNCWLWMAGKFTRLEAFMPTRIEWCQETWSPVTGCTAVSAGCDNCYARRMVKRLQANPRTAHKYRNGFQVTCHPEELEKPLHWRKPRMVFVPSMGDLWHKDVPDEFIDKVCAVMGLCKQHLFVILTKRPSRMTAYMNSCARYGFINESAHQLVGDSGFALLPTQRHGMVPGGLPFSNIWPGVSVESQDEDHRIHELLKVPAAGIVVSYEPALGGLILPPEFLERGKQAWCIAGGETGPRARPMNPRWARDVRDQCVAAGVPYFHKQNGMWMPVDTVGDDPDPKGRSAMAYKDGTVDQNWQPGLKCVGAQVLWRVTKQQADRLLDGKEWNQSPGGLNAHL